MASMLQHKQNYIDWRNQPDELEKHLTRLRQMSERAQAKHYVGLTALEARYVREDINYLIGRMMMAEGYLGIRLSAEQEDSPVVDQTV